MKLCPQCTPSLLPFAMIAVIAAVVGFLTWLTLGLSDVGQWVRIGVTAGAFAAVAVALWHYVVTCIRRHCRHEERFSRMAQPPPRV